MVLASVGVKELETKQTNLQKMLDILFIVASIIFFISVSIIFISVKLGNIVLLQVVGVLSVSMSVPFLGTLIGYLKERAEKQVIIPLVIILFYFVLEIVWDYLLRIPFREILVLHIFYIIILYLAAFNMIGVSFRIHRRMGFVVTITFWILLGSLIYMYLG
jgi:hypothetical protein